MKLCTARQMAEIDRRAIESFHIPSLTLMENAGRALFEEMHAGAQTVAAVFIKAGKNGGDGLVAARLLLQCGARVRCFMVGEPRRMADDTAAMQRRFESAGGRVEVLTHLDDETLDYCYRCTVAVDAMFGTGLSRPLEGLDREAVELINALPAKVFSADLPSGIAADTGRVMGAAVRAHCTVTFSYAKPAHFLEASAPYCARVVTRAIGIPPETAQEQALTLSAADWEEIDAGIPVRDECGHKGTFGRVLAVCGARGSTGAPFFSMQAAVRSGAGLVYALLADDIYPILAAKLAEPVLISAPSDRNGRLSVSAAGALSKALRTADACLFGCGLGASEDVRALLALVLRESRAPVVIDADGINVLARNIDILKTAKAPVILTPHPGEYRRLRGALPEREALLQDAAAFAQELGVTLVLKGHRTITASPDGRACINTTGNSGMAKGGSGDVLAGVVTALLAQGAQPYEAARAAVFVHGMAGDFCARDIGRYGMTPSDMLEALPAVFQKLEARRG